MLSLLHAAGLPVPRPRYADDSASVLGGPYLVTDFVDGDPVTDVDRGLAEELAGFLARLHGLGVTRSALPHLRDIRASADQRIRQPPAVPDETLSESAIRAALATAWPPPRDNSGILLHGDYWPGNTLWRDGRLAGVVDWEDAVLGDPVAELAGARMELWMLSGAAAATAFTRSLPGAAPADRCRRAAVLGPVRGATARRADARMGTPAGRPGPASGWPPRFRRGRTRPGCATMNLDDGNAQCSAALSERAPPEGLNGLRPSADDMRRGARLVDAMMDKPPNQARLRQALHGGDAEGIARALAVAVIMMSGPAGYSHDGLRQEMQRMVWEFERLEHERSIR